MKRIYLDNAATTPMDNEVLEAMMPFLREEFGNPSSTHGFGRKTKAGIETARKQVATFLNASPSEIIFSNSANLCEKSSFLKFFNRIDASLLSSFTTSNSLSNTFTPIY